MQHAVDQSFTQCAARQRHAIDTELLEDGDQNRQAAGEHQRPLQRQPFDFQLFQFAALNGALLQLLQLIQRDALIHALRHHDLLQRLNRARGTNTGLPALLTQLRCNRLDHFTRRQLGLVKVLFAR